MASLRITTLGLRSFVMGKADRCRTFLKCEARLGYHLILGPLFWEFTYHGALSDTEFHLSKHCGHKPKDLRLMEEGNFKAKKVTSS
jgi:hypothetical protein